MHRAAAQQGNNNTVNSLAVCFRCRSCRIRPTVSSKTTRRLGAALANTPEERLKIILNQALDEALRLYVVNLFSVWMKDPTGQPDRAREGLEKALKAWQHAVDAINHMEIKPEDS